MSPPTNKFGFAIVSPESNSVETYAVAAALSPTNVVGESPPVYSSASDAEDTDDFASLRSPSTTKYTVDQSRNSPEFVASEFASPPSPIPARLPRLSRAISLPIPSELGYLRHPTKPKLRGPTLTAQDEVSVELADSVQAVVQTILHLSPPHLLDPVKEQFSACTIQLPTPSVSSLLTTMKNLNYMSANLSSFASEPGGSDDPGEQTLGHFDIGEVIQSVADVLSGTAAQANVDLVLFHADVGMKHVNVVGDECCISFVLAHILRQIINSAHPNDAVEVGLHIQSANSTEDASGDMTNTESLGDNISPIILEEGAPLTCTLNINHRSKSEYENENESGYTPDEPTEADDQWGHREPKLDSLFLRRLLHRIKAVLTVNPCPTTSLICDIAYSITFNLTQGVSPLSPSSSSSYLLRPEEEAARQPFQPNFKLAKEPTLEELAIFTETSLKGKRAVFHASETSTFAHHLTSYLTNWGLDLQHVPMGAPFDDEPGQSLGDRRNAESGYGNTGQTLGLEPFTTPNSSASQQSQDSQNTLDASGAGKVNSEPSFIIIDDDINVLRRRLGKYRPETPYPLHLHPRKRPSLATNHRPRSTPHVRQFLINTTPVTFIHFTSLANYKLVRDAVHSAFFLLPASQIPEVIVIPKPAGPRRFLTALHTAVRRPYVDPSFFPIATSPQSPGAMSPVSQPASFMGQNGSGAGGGSTSGSASTRSNASGTSPTASASRNSVNNSQSAHSPSEWIGPTRSPRDRGYSNTSSNGTPDYLPHVPTPSPLAADSLEYFSETAAKIGGGTAASGLVIQSPDGRPAGIFFQPQRSASRSSGRSDSTPSAPPLVSSSSRGHLERETRLANNGGNIGSSPMSRRPSTESRNPSKLSRTLSSASRPSSSEGPSGDPASPLAFGSNDVSAIRRQRGITLAGPTRRSEYLDDPQTPTSASFPNRSHSRPTSAHGTVDSPSSPAANPDEPGVRLSLTSSNSGSRKTIGRSRAGSASTIERRKTSTGTQGPDQGSPLSPVQLQNIATPAQSQIIKNDEKKPARPMVRTTSRRPATGDTPLGPRKPSQQGSPHSTSNNQLPHTGKGIPRKASSDVKNITKGKMGGITPPISVLIVEDNPINQAIMTTWMRRRKFKYGTAKDGAEAVEKWRTGGFHLILMDIQMPVMNGIEATKEIRRLEKLSYASAFPSATPPGDQSRANSALSDLARTAPPTPFHSSVIIVALTASSLESDRVKALAAGCNDFLTKPVSLPWLDKKIIEWGSIKALQMWANPELTKDIQTGQDAKVKAFQLHIPRTETRASPTPTPTSAVPTTGSDTIPPVIVPVSASSNEPKAATDVPLPVPEASHSKGDNQTPFIGGEEALSMYLSEQDTEESRNAFHRTESLIKHGRKGVSPTAPSITSVLSTPVPTHDALPPATDAAPLPNPNICNIKQPSTPIITPPSPPGEKYSN